MAKKAPKQWGTLAAMSPTDATDPSERSIQERLYPTLKCFGCGHANADGLHLRSYARSGGVVVASFTPGPQHDNGFGTLNGGIISTVLDCHTAAAVLLEAHGRGWEPAYVTAGFDVRFLRPAPLDATSELVARLVEIGEDAMIAEAELTFDGKIRATMRATWKRFRPRHGASIR
jgi:acyl-coenzyme A thioesterase PaaI-like protein